LVIGGTPYIVFYRVRGKRVTISTIWHGAQARPKRRNRTSG
jgi:plasmid stabilization system protein ParE